MKKLILILLVGMTSCKAGEELYKHQPSSRSVNRAIRKSNWQYIMPKVKMYDTYTLTNSKL